MSAPNILRQSAETIEDRAAERDQPGGERSMGRTVDAFNALTGHKLTERDGWLFMCALKMARACTTPTGRPDDYIDLAAYAALAGEFVTTPGPVNDNQGKKNHKWTEIFVSGQGIVRFPSWVKWLAQDKNGTWYGYDEKPDIGIGNAWIPRDLFNSQSCKITDAQENDEWRETLQEIKL